MVLGPQPPGTDGLTGRLAAIEKRIETGIKSAGMNQILCIVRLNADVAGIAADTRPVTQWKPTAEIDTRGMYHYNQSGDTWWQIPFQGRWSVFVHTRWLAPSTAGLSSTSVLLNGTVPASSAIAEVNAYNGGFGMAYNVLSEDRVFAPGDILRINFYSSTAATLKATTLAAYTHVTIRYLGSE